MEKTSPTSEKPTGLNLPLSCDWAEWVEESPYVFKARYLGPEEQPAPAARFRLDPSALAAENGMGC